MPAELLKKAGIPLISNPKSYLQLYQGFFFAPVYEHEHDGAFLTKQAYEAMEEGDFNKVPLMSDHDFVKSVLKFAEQLVKTLAKTHTSTSSLTKVSWVFTEISQLVVGVGVRSFSITDSCTPELTQTVPYFHWIQFLSN
ncbi:unnamed protein product [Acanthoscelides obtectus]|uniref:Uncharacterized protein n=1 Tax=Acanthoscelides obtectus TaxID=200917 RepID=A0A9P0QFE2_ACAOB|nr:unnamed protein product [Acanthoscelides obtectus]CAK1684623.1 hypothetical protein AOBTE_LOCUS34976 [Acanthoscelides obtectus]